MAPRGAVSAPVALTPPERVERVTTLRLALGDLRVAALKLRVREDTRHFIETARAFAEEDRLRGYFLFVEQLPVAYLLCTARDAVIFYDHVGHDPDFAFLSPDTVLLYHVLERLMGEGRWRMLEFSGGEAPHKSLFATDAVRCADIFCLRRTWRLVAAARLHALVGDVSTGLGAALHRAGLKSRVKKWLRGAAC